MTIGMGLPRAEVVITSPGISENAICFPPPDTDRNQSRKKKNAAGLRLNPYTEDTLRTPAPVVMELTII